MTRIFDFEYPEFTTNDLFKEMIFVKTNKPLIAAGVLWFFVSTIYLLLLNLYAICLMFSFEIVYLAKFYTFGMGIIFMSRILVGYILENLD
jgi:hypothetical protein